MKSEIEGPYTEPVEAGKWIPVKDRLPSEGERVLTYTEGEIIEGFLNEYGWNYTWLDCHGCGCCGGNTDNTTHWMPLPDPPK